ncbi:MAG: family 43 glycosylhydrolase [Parasporobacterium sp.]|nr:family 43 glycosylhydrolase [Parasporobacterium sp.]
MKASEFSVRDPYILLHGDTYYLYGTRSETAWSDYADGFDVYRSTDLENWEGPIEIFRRPEGFWADRYYWAPECIEYQGAFYLLTTFGSAQKKKGIYVLKADRPEGPFAPWGDRLTPEDWTCIDGTICFEGDKVYLVYSHSFEDSPTGDMCCQQLSEDLTHAVSDPVRLFEACEAPWATPVPFAKEEFGMEGDVYFTDGPCLFRKDGKLYMTWSSWSARSYAVGLACSESGSVAGPWVQRDKPFFPENGGHGMVFADKQGKLQFVLHYPNDKYQEHLLFTGLDL